MINFFLPESVEVAGKTLDIRSGTDTALKIICCMNDNELENDEKCYVALNLFYVDFDAILDIQEAYKRLIWFLDGGEERPKKSNAPRVMDWEKDFPLIIAPINKSLGYDIRSKPNTHWWTFLAAYSCMGECTFSQIVGIRRKLAKHTKLEKWEEKFYKENRFLIDLPNRYDRETQDEIDSIIG